MKMASTMGRKTVAVLIAISAVVIYYAVIIPVPPHLSSTDYFTLRLSAFVLDMVSIFVTSSFLHSFISSVILPSSLISEIVRPIVVKNVSATSG